MASRFEGKQVKIAEALDKTPNYISRCLSMTMAPEHRKNIGEEFAREIESKLGLSRYQLDQPNFGEAATVERGVEATLAGPISVWGDETPLDEDEVSIPLLKDVRVAAGSGYAVEEFDSGKRIRMGKHTLRNQGVQFDQAVCVTVRGNSMEPALPEGSTVGVNLAATSVKDGKVYVLRQDGELRVKQLYRLPGNGLRLRSFNRAEHDDEDYTSQQMIDKDISIMGKVFWSSVLWD